MKYDDHIPERTPEQYERDRQNQALRHAARVQEEKHQANSTDS